MGHRANLILVEDKEPKIYYSHWDGQNTPNILSQGLEFCEKHFKKFKEDGWLMDNAWAEGGILIDKDNKVVQFFNVELLEVIAIRNRFIDFLQKNIWTDWSIKWAYKGNVDFAEYLGIMEDYILAKGCNPNYHKFKNLNDLILEEDKEWASRTLVTIVSNNIIKDYVILGYCDEIDFCLAEGIDLKDNIPSVLEISTPKNIKEAEIEDVLLVDYNSKDIFICWTDDKDDRHIDYVKNIWNGWDCKRQTKGVEFNFEYTQREKSYTKIEKQEFDEYLKKWKLLEYK